MSMAEVVSDAKIFGLCTIAPYLRDCMPLRPKLGTEHSGTGRYSYFEYISDLCKLHPDDYNGPFTLGVWWEEPDYD